MMDWLDVFYIADLRDVHKGSWIENSHTDNDAYMLHVKPNGYYPPSKHYCMGSCGDYFSKLESISKIVSMWKSPREFYERHMQMTDRFRIISIAESERMEYYYENYQDDIQACEDDIKEAIKRGKTMFLRKSMFNNLNVEIHNIHKPVGKRKLVNMDGKYAEWVDEELFDVILSFDGHTKRELYSLLEDCLDVEPFNEMLRALRENGVKGIAELKQLKKSDLALYLTDVINEWYLGGEEVENEYAICEQEEE